MNLAHAHLVLNHFPTIGTIVGLGLFILAILTKSDDLKRVSLIIFFLIALLSLPTFATGTAAQLALTDNADVPTPMIEAHESAAFVALGFMELTGALAWLGLWQIRRSSHLPTRTWAAVLVAAVVTFGLMGWTANLGEEIRHDEVRIAVITGSATEDATTEKPLARAIGDAMVNITWIWAVSETIHFLGLTLLIGVVLVVDLRMLGFLKGIPFSTLHRLLPWGVLGFGVNLATGILFFIGAPPTFYVTNGLFFWKLALILVAGVNALYFTAFEEPWKLGADDTPPFTAKIAAASGIALWIGVLFCGQMLPFFGNSF